MGKTFTAYCEKCKKLYNFDVGIGRAYSKEILLDSNNQFNLSVLYKRNSKRKKELLELLKKGEFTLEEDYGHKMCICDTCGKIYSRFIFSLIKEDGTKFEPKYKCRECGRLLRTLLEEEIIKKEFICPDCNCKIKFYESGKWN